MRSDQEDENSGARHADERAGEKRGVLRSLIGAVRNLSKRVTVGLAISVFGLTLGVVAFYFDIFGYMVDRSENISNTEMLRQLADDKKIVVLPVGLEHEAEYILFFDEQDEPQCEVFWGSESNFHIVNAGLRVEVRIHSAALSHLHNLEGGYPAFQVYMADNQDEWTPPFLLSHDWDQCFYQDQRDYSIDMPLCTNLYLERDLLGALRSDKRMFLQPYSNEISKLTENGLRAYREIFLDAADDLINEFHEAASEFDAAVADLEAEGGVRRASPAKEEIEQILIKVDDQGVGRWELDGEKYADDFFGHDYVIYDSHWAKGELVDRYFVFRPEPPNKEALWIPRGLGDVPRMKIDVHRVAEAMRVLDEVCLKIPPEARSGSHPVRVGEYDRPAHTLEIRD